MKKPGPTDDRAVDTEDGGRADKAADGGGVLVGGVETGGTRCMDWEQGGGVVDVAKGDSGGWP